MRKLLALLLICGLFSLGCGGDTGKEKDKKKPSGGPPSGMDKGKMPPMGDKDASKSKPDDKDKDEDKDKTKPEKPSPEKKEKDKEKKDKNGVP